jgi:tripartite-type tricarboxylate transporter receptor subunit TctC
MSLLVNDSVPARTVAELLRLIERHPGDFNAAFSNSTAELAVAQLVGRRQVLTVPYKGDVPALIDLVSGRVHFMFATGASSAPFVADGRLRRLGSTAPGGGLDVDVTPWMGLFGPAGLPKERIQEFTRAVKTALHDGVLQQRFVEQGFQVHALSAEELEAYFRLQYGRFVAAARRSGLKLER